LLDSLLQEIVTMGTIKKKEMTWNLLNFLWSCIVVAPLTVLFWRGTWDLLAIMVYPEFPAEDAPSKSYRKDKSGLVCFIMGALIRIFLDLIKFHFGEFVQSKPRVMKKIGGLTFTCLYAMAGVSFWRGIWLLMKLDVGEKTVQLCIVLFGGLAILSFSHISRTLIGSPLALCLDTHENIFKVSTFFMKTPDAKVWFLSDVLFTNLVVRTMVVFCWWSLWSLEDRILILNKISKMDKTIAYDSIILGYGAALLAFLLDILIEKTTTTKQYIQKPLRVITIFLAFFASMNVWRGVWSIYDSLLFPGIPVELNYIASLVTAFLALTFLLLSNTICNDHIVLDKNDGRVIGIQYWQDKPKLDEEDEMIPIVD